MSAVGTDARVGPEPPALVELLALYAPSLVPEGWHDWVARDTSPFLTVVVRTQGRRPLLLEEALTCLVGQTIDDFEVVLVAHDPTVEELAVLEQTVADFEGLLGRGCRLVLASGGSRSRPIRVGIGHARGRYAVVLDDDDHVFAHWVETLAELERRRPGALLRTGCAVRRTRETSFPFTTAPVRLTAAPIEPQYTDPFDLREHIAVNRTPIHAYAFPLYAVRELGLDWDEDLPVVEDWHFLIRCAAVCGVEEDMQVTAVYNQGVADSSSAVVQESVWRATEDRLRQVLQDTPAPLPPGALPPVSARRAVLSRAELARLARATRYVYSVEGWAGIRQRVKRRSRLGGRQSAAD